MQTNTNKSPNTISEDQKDSGFQKIRVLMEQYQFMNTKNIFSRFCKWAYHSNQQAMHINNLTTKFIKSC